MADNTGKKNKSDLATRCISACFMLPLLAFLWLGGYWLLAVVFICCARCMHEFYNGWEKLNVKPVRWVGYLSFGIWMGLVNWRYLYEGGREDIAFDRLFCLWLFVTMSLALSCVIFGKKDDHSIASGPVAALGALYIGFLGSHICMLRYIPQGNILIWFPFLISIGTDSMAYFVGCRFGKYTKKMAPAISPNKSMAGFYGGMFGGPLCCVIFALLFAKEMILHAAIMGFVGSFFSQGGDLVESAFKRKMGIKDFSNLIPGHGGALDRLDSALFTSSFVFYYAVFIMGVLK